MAQFFPFRINETCQVDDRPVRDIYLWYTTGSCIYQSASRYSAGNLLNSINRFENIYANQISVPRLPWTSYGLNPGLQNAPACIRTRTVSRISSTVALGSQMGLLYLKREMQLAELDANDTDAITRYLREVFESEQYKVQELRIET